MSVDGSFGWYSNSRSNDVIYFQQWSANLVLEEEGSTFYLAKPEPVVLDDQIKIDFLYR